MNLKCLWLWLLMLGAGAASAAPPPRETVTADPNDPEKNRTMISREDREVLGLKPHTWTGVVEPEVYARLDRLNKMVANMKDRLNKARDEQAFDLLQRVRFQGTVYVQIQLRADAEIKDAQRRVLASVKASEFQAPHLLEKAPGLIGFTTKDGLDKLAKNPDVAGVCLDDNPLPEKAKTIYKDDLPAAQPGDAASTQPGVAERKVDPDVYRALDLADRVDVVVSLRTDSLPALGGPPSEMRTRWELRKQAERQLQDRVLSTLSADDLLVWGRHGPAVSGFISRQGLEKLWTHPDVQAIGLRELERIPERNLRSR